MIDYTQLKWPEPPTNIPDNEMDLKKALYASQLQFFTDQLATMREHDKATLASYEAFKQMLNNAYLDVAKGQIDRGRARAEFLERAAATLAGFYTGLLGFVFSIDKTKGSSFPLVGIIPTIFLGLSILFTSVYLSYIRRPASIEASEPSGLLSRQIINDRNDFIVWTSEAVLQRARWLQSAVISLGMSIFFLPVGFLNIQGIYIWFAAVIGLILALFLPFFLKRA